MLLSCFIGELVEEPLERAGLLACISNFDVLIVRLGHQIDREILDAGERIGLKLLLPQPPGLIILTWLMPSKRVSAC